MGAGSLVSALLASPPLLAAGVIMDDHFVARDRMGRMMAFVARVVADGASAPGAAVRGVGVDEVTALLVAPDGTLRAVGDGTAYMCESRAPASATVCERGSPLTLPDVHCERLQSASFDDCDDPSDDTFDLGTWRGSGVRYTYDIIDGKIDGRPYGPE